MAVGIDSAALQGRLRDLLPGEQGIKVSTAADSVVLSGEVSSAQQADYAVSIAEAFARWIARAIACLRAWSVLEA